MPSIWFRLAAFGVVLLGLASVAALHFSETSVHANGRKIEFERRIVGPYEIAFGKIPPSPVVGNFFISILLTDAVSESPVLGANVVVSATGPPAEGETSPTRQVPEIEQPEIGPLIVSPDPDQQAYPGYYDTAPIPLDRKGWWTFSVLVDSPAGGEATAEFLVYVDTPNPIVGIMTLLALLAFIVVVALAIRMYFRERGRMNPV